MAEIYDLQSNQDWGNFDDGNVMRPATGAEVQKFIKSQFIQLDENKPGYFFSIDETEKNQNILLGFKDESIYKSWFGDGENLDLESNLIISKTTLNKSIPEPYYVAGLESETPTNYISLDNNVVLKFKFTYKKIDQNAGTVTDGEADNSILIIERRSNANDSWSSVYEANVSPNGDFFEIDITDGCNDGSQEVRVTVSSPNNFANPFSTSLRYNVTKTKVELKYTKDWTQAQTGKYMNLAFGILGSVDKKLHVEISGPGGKTPRSIVRTDIGKNTYNTDQGANAYSFNVLDLNTDSYKVLTHGVHTIKAWLEIVETGQEVSHIQFQVMMRSDLEDNTPYLILNNVNNTPTNWAQQKLFDYCVFDPAESYREFTAVLKDYNTDIEYLKLGPENISTNTKYSYSNTLEIEGSDNPFYAQMLFLLDGESIIDPVEFAVRNTGAYGPTTGAHFILDPKSRSNNEANNENIYNKVNGELVNSLWTGFNHNNDAWIETTQGRCLRVLSGQTIDIDYNPYYSDGVDVWEDKSCTIEMVVSVNNIINPETPLFTICNYSENGNFNGIEIKPNNAAVMTTGQTIYKNQDIVFQEGVKTHIAFNFINNIYSYEKVDENKKPTGEMGSINLIRIFVNGRINREFAYNSSEVLTDNSNTTNPRRIIIGNINDSADLDIYSMRVYKKKLDTNSIFNDYISSLSTIEEKDVERFANDIVQNGSINYDLAKVKYNTLLWQPCERDPKPTTLASKLSDGKFPGDLVVSVLTEGEDGEMVVDKSRSGIIKDLRVKGQGTSSMTYWKWNQRWEFDKIETGEKDEDNEPICYETLFYAEDGSEPIGSWLVEDGCPRAKRIDGKINWASPMQSHKLGSTSLYHDLWKAVVGNNAITSRSDGQSFTGTKNGYADCRVAIKQLPFLVFQRKEVGGDIEFVGLYTVGASKGDKPTFGYNKKDDRIKPFLMMEGCDNGAALVNHRIPWNHDDIFADCSDGIVFMYNKVKQWEVSMGDDSFDVIFNGEEPADKTNVKNTFKSYQLELFRQMNNFIYELNPDIHPFTGTNINDTNQNSTLNKQSFYWMVSNKPDHGSQYDVYRYHEVLGKWVNAGVNRLVVDGVTQEEYETLNLLNQCKSYYTPAGGTYEYINQQFIDARVKLFNDNITKYIHTDDLRYTMQFLKLIAASDNWAKNTYPYSTGWNKDWVKGSDSLDYVEKFRFFQDDLDTIFASNNTGQKTKPYYVEEHDIDENNAPYWNASTNGLYCLAEKAWPSSLRMTMYNILQAMKELGGSVEGCFDKYYNNVQRYFPAICYNEIARLLYEDAKINKDAGIYEGIEPLSQCLGDQLQAEKYWQNNRIPYLSSYAMYGEFEASDGVASSGYFNFRSTLVDNAQHEYKFKLTPYIWLYPSIGIGQSSYTGTDDELPKRVKAGETFEFPKFTTDGNTNIFVRGINNYVDVDDFGNVATALTSEGKNISISGKRMTKFEVTERDTTKGILFRPEQLTFASNMTNLSRLVIKGSAYQSDIITGELDLKSLWRLNYVDLTGTKATTVYLPENGNIKDLLLPETIINLSLKNLKVLSNFKLNSYKKLKNLEVIGCDNLNNYDIFNSCYNSKSELESLKLYNVNWENFTLDQLNYLLNIPVCELTGTINIPYAISFEEKMLLMNKFGDIDNNDGDNNLKVIYSTQTIQDFSVFGPTYLTKAGKYQYTCKSNGNDFTAVQWNITGNPYATINKNTGEVAFEGNNTEEKPTATITCTLWTPNAPNGVSREKTIYFYKKDAEVGDYVYADGSYGLPSDDLGDKTIVAMCFYVNPNNNNDRLAAAVELATPNKVFWGLSSYGVSGLGESIYNVNYLTGKSSTGVTSAEVPEYSGWYINSLATSKVGTGYYSNVTALGDLGNEELGYDMTTEIPSYIKTDVLPAGLRNTLFIIEHRNQTAIPKGLTTSYKDYISIPGKTVGGYNVDEMNDLNTKLNNLTSIQPSYTGFYYPAASYCYAYKPTQSLKEFETLNNDIFGAHKWFLPSTAELALFWYQVHNNEVFKNIFYKNNEQYVIPNEAFIWTSTEGSDANKAYAMQFKIPTGSSAKAYLYGASNGDKCSLSNPGQCYVLPIVRF